MSNDITQIKQTLAEYCHRVDRGSAAEVAALFRPDAVLRPRFDGDYEVRGRARIEAWYAHYHAQLRPAIRHLMHHVGSALVTVQGERAESTCYFIATFVTAADGKAVLVPGRYTDSLVRDGSRWLFGERLIESHFVATLIEVTETFPSLGWPGE